MRLGGKTLSFLSAITWEKRGRKQSNRAESDSEREKTFSWTALRLHVLNTTGIEIASATYRHEPYRRKKTPSKILLVSWLLLYLFFICFATVTINCWRSHRHVHIHCPVPPSAPIQPALVLACSINRISAVFDLNKGRSQTQAASQTSVGLFAMWTVLFLKHIVCLSALSVDTSYSS